MPITINQFRATAKFVQDVGAYTGQEFGAQLPGYVYMDGSYCIEQDGGTWLLTLGNMGYRDECLAKVEARLYQWMLTEAEGLMAFPFRLPKLPISPSNDDAAAWVGALAAEWPGELFPNEAAALQLYIACVCRCHTTPSKETNA